MMIILQVSNTSHCRKKETNIQLSGSLRVYKHKFPQHGITKWLIYAKRSERLVIRPHLHSVLKKPKDFNHNRRVSLRRSELCTALLFELFHLQKNRNPFSKTVERCRSVLIVRKKFILVSHINLINRKALSPNHITYSSN